jgi:hypothetical protein
MARSRITSALDPNAQGGDAAFRKFVNESYHIENEYLMQLNPREFDAVPEHVVQACADLLVKRGRRPGPGTTLPPPG